MWGLGPSHLAVLAVIAVLLFGDRLPEVMRSLGKGLIEFKKGMRGLEGAIETAANSSARRSTPTSDETEEREEPTAPRFQPPPAEPRLEAPTAVAQETTAPEATTSHDAATAPSHDAVAVTGTATLHDDAAQSSASDEPAKPTV